MEAGQVLKGIYRVEREIGRGGMGFVLEATDLTLGRRVAIKFPTAEVVADPRLRSRFFREARAAAKLASKHVTRVLRIDELDDGTPFVVMELLTGETVEARLAREGPLPPATAIDIVRQALEGLVEAHGAGLVHRDIKPSNLFLATPSGRAGGDGGAATVKLLDFGLVLEGDGQVTRMTRTGDAFGSVDYAAPEQLRDAGRVDARADVWAVGVTLYELLSGEMPFRGATLHEIVRAVRDQPPIPFARSTPAALEAIVMRCLEKEPTARFADAAELAAALDAVREKPELVARAVRSSPPLSETRDAAETVDAADVQPPAPAPPSPAAPRQRTRLRSQPPRRWGLLFGISLAVGALAAVVMLVVVASRMHADPPARAAPSVSLAPAEAPSTTPVAIAVLPDEDGSTSDAAPTSGRPPPPPRPVAKPISVWVAAVGAGRCSLSLAIAWVALHRAELERCGRLLVVGRPQVFYSVALGENGTTTGSTEVANEAFRSCMVGVLPTVRSTMSCDGAYPRCEFQLLFRVN